MVLNILRTDMDISIKISVSQTIIGNKKLLHILKTFFVSLVFR